METEHSTHEDLHYWVANCDVRTDEPIEWEEAIEMEADAPLWR